MRCGAGLLVLLQGAGAGYYGYRAVCILGVVCAMKYGCWCRCRGWLQDVYGSVGMGPDGDYVKKSECFVGTKKYFQRYCSGKLKATAGKTPMPLTSGWENQVLRPFRERRVAQQTGLEELGKSRLSSRLFESSWPFLSGAQ